MFFEIYWTFSFSLTLSHTQKNVDGYFLAFDLDPDPIPTKMLGSATLFIKFKIFFFICVANMHSSDTYLICPVPKKKLIISKYHYQKIKPKKKEREL